MIKTDSDTYQDRYRGDQPLRTLLALYGKDRGRLILAVFLHIIKHSPMWIMPLLTANIINIITEPDLHPLSELWVNATLLGVSLAQNIPMHYLFVRTFSIANRNMEAGLRSRICRRLQYLSFSFYNRSNTGALQAKVLRDVEVIEQLTRQLSNIIPYAVVTIIAAIVITAIRVPRFLVFYLTLGPAAVLLIRLLRNPLNRRNRNFRKDVESMSSRVIEMIQLIPVTRAHGVEEYEIEQIEQELENLKHAGLKLDSITAVFGATSWVTFQGFNAAVLVVAAWLHYNRLIPITVGDVVMLTGYFGSITQAVLTLTNVLPEITKGFESIRSLGEVLESPDIEHNEGKLPVSSVEGRFAFENVSFSYPETDENSIKDFCLEVEPGETIAVVGPSGAGKSTLINLIIGFLRPSSGRILLDGQDMNTLDLRGYRQFLSVVSQETILFNGTVRENILYGNPDFDEDFLYQAIDDANALDFVQRQPQGLETILGDRGTRLSGGEKQRIAIARALIRQPKVLLLDEATSALDVETEAEIQEALERLMIGRTTFVVAHRLSTVRNADRIVVMDRGRMVEIGSHDELVRRKGVYQGLIEQSH